MNHRLHFWKPTMMACLALQALVMPLSTEAAQIVSRQQASRLGLARAWSAQIALDLSRTRVTDTLLDGDLLLVQDDSGALHALDSASGRQRWVAQLGQHGHAAMRPASNGRQIAFVSGPRLMLLDRATGRILNELKLDGAAGAGPALGESHVYVPRFSGIMDVFAIETLSGTPRSYRSAGRNLVQPLLTPDRICWPADDGVLYVADTHEQKLLYRLEMATAVVAPPAYSAPLLLAASLDGFVYAVHTESGNLRWRAATGGVLRDAPVPMGPHVYVSDSLYGLWCLDMENGEILWRAPGIGAVGSASEHQAFASLSSGGIVALDRLTGRRLGHLLLGEGTTLVTNTENDRIYVVAPTGLLQCLYDTAHPEPYQHRPAPPDAPVAEETPAADRPFVTEPPAAAAATAPAAPTAPGDPVVPAAETAVEDPFGGADPFGGDAAEADAANPFE